MDSQSLDALIRSMNPELDSRVYVFAALDSRLALDPDLDPLCTFEEREGITVIVRREVATSHGLAFTFPCQRISLRVYSSLDAVGLLAAVSQVLAEHGISVNVVSAFHHDHLFVAVDEAERALQLLRELQQRFQ